MRRIRVTLTVPLPQTLEVQGAIPAEAAAGCELSVE